MESHLLKAVSEIKLGYLPRVALGDVANTGVRLLQIRDVSNIGLINYNSAVTVDLCADELNRFEVKSGDVLLTNRGDCPRAALVENPPPATLASAHFFIIRTQNAQITPAFLAWLLNRQKAQNYFKMHMVGTSLKILNKSVLEEMDLAIPDLMTQGKIIQVDRLIQRHADLAAQLQEKLGKVISHLSSQGAIHECR